MLQRLTRPNLAEQAFLRWLQQDDAAQQADYRLYRNYYNGDHNVPLTDRQKEYLQRNGVTFSFNFLALPIKVLAQRLQVIGFDGPPGIGGDDGILWRWWNAGRMDGIQKAVHRATLVDGDSYVLCEWDNEAGMPRFYHEPAYDGSEGVKVTYASNSRGAIQFASKRWREVDPNAMQTWRRLNIYTADAIYKYRTSSEAGEYGWAKYIEDGDAAWPLVWPVGIIPVVPFRNDDDGGPWGRSELHDLLPVQNALNKSVVDLLQGSDMTAYQLITLTGGKATNIDINPRTVLYHPDPAASWGSIPAGDIEKLIRLKNDFIMTISQLSQVPLSYFQVTGQVASDATQKADDSGMVAKARDTSVSLGNSWEDVARLALAMSNEFGGTAYNPGDIGTLWDEFERVDRLQTRATQAQILATLITAGATLEGATLVAGYNDEERAALISGDMVEPPR